jgi:hypothetical protein
MKPLAVMVGSATRWVAQEVGETPLRPYTKERGKANGSKEGFVIILLSC